MDEVTICIGFILVVLFLLILLILVRLLFSKPITYKKAVSKQGLTNLTITAKRDINKITVIAKLSGGDDIKFQRNRLHKDRVVDFSYPASGSKTKIIVEMEKGKEKIFEV